MLTQSFSFSETSSFPSNGATLIAGICRCMDLTCNTTSTPFPPNHREPNTIAFQKVMAKQLAIFAWQARWCNTDRHPPCPPESSCPPSQICRCCWGLPHGISYSHTPRLTCQISAMFFTASPLSTLASHLSLIASLLTTGAGHLRTNHKPSRLLSITP